MCIISKKIPIFDICQQACHHLIADHMKTLYIVRHGKSSWEDPSLEDYERPLLPIGEERTARMGTYLAGRKISPDLIISSHAVRAFETARLLASALSYPRHKIQIDSQIYHGGSEGLWSLVFGLPDHKEQVMMVGHNPAMTQFANGLLDKSVDYLPTSAVVSVSFFTPYWHDLLMAEKKVNFITYPKHLEKSS